MRLKPASKNNTAALPSAPPGGSTRPSHCSSHPPPDQDRASVTKAAAHSSGANERRGSSERPPSRKRILLVDDDIETSRLIARMLSQTYDVSVAANGITGLALASTLPELDLIITDVTMPLLDGINMIRRIRKLSARRFTPVIFLTARSDPQDILEGIQVGARHYLTKPIDIDELERKTSKLVVPLARGSGG